MHAFQRMFSGWLAQKQQSLCVYSRKARSIFFSLFSIVLLFFGLEFLTLGLEKVLKKS